MKITNIELILNRKENSNVKAFVRIILNDSLIIHNLRIVQGKQRLFVAFPDRKYKGKYVESVHPITAEFRQQIETEILDSYHHMKEN